MVWTQPAAFAGGSMFGLGGFLGDATDFVGDMLSGGAVSNARSVRETNEAQIGLSNTAYQRAVADMKAAGLNPALAYSQGPAQTPGLQAPRPGDVAGSIGEQAKSLAGVYANLKNTSANTVKTQEETTKTQKQNAILDEEQREVKANADEAEVSAEIAKAMKGAALKHAKYDKEFAAADAGAKRLGGIGKAFAGLLGMGAEKAGHSAKRSAPKKLGRGEVWTDRSGREHVFTGSYLKER